MAFHEFSFAGWSLYALDFAIQRQENPLTASINCSSPSITFLYRYYKWPRPTKARDNRNCIGRTHRKFSWSRARVYSQRSSVGSTPTPADRAEKRSQYAARSVTNVTDVTQAPRVVYDLRSCRLKCCPFMSQETMSYNRSRFVDATASTPFWRSLHPILAKLPPHFSEASLIMSTCVCLAASLYWS